MRLTRIDESGKKKRSLDIDLSKGMSIAASIGLAAAGAATGKKLGFLDREVMKSAVRGEAMTAMMGVTGYEIGRTGGAKLGKMIQERHGAREGRSEIVKRSWRARRQKYGKMGRSR